MEKMNKKVKNKLLKYFLYIILFVFIANIAYRSNLKKKELNIMRDKVEYTFLNELNDNVSRIDFISNKDSSVFFSINNNNKISSFIEAMKSFEYEKANHPSSTNSKSFYLKLIDNNNIPLYSLKVTIMNGGYTADRSFYKILYRDSHRYSSKLLYEFLVNQGIYDESRRDLNYEY